MSCSLSVKAWRLATRFNFNLKLSKNVKSMQRFAILRRLFIKTYIMKKYTLVIAVLACTLMLSVSSRAQTVTRNVSGYTGVESNGPFNVTVTIDGTESIKLDVDADALDDIKTEVENGVLKVGFKNGWKNHRNLKHANIYITAKSLNYLANGGSGSTVLTGMLTGDNAKVSVSGSGNLKCAVTSQSLDLHVSGSGGLDVKGSTGQADVSVSGSGSINGRQLKTETVSARISGSGEVVLIANKSVSGRISGSGSLQYSGNATIGESHTSGSGRISKID
ncbi:DUF2807 domain-containing protein [Inquilinus sp. KBS0705]|nr:DUF2807 domain-containing protein [Inquilinus sp. KBS0705]